MPVAPTDMTKATKRRQEEDDEEKGEEVWVACTTMLPTNRPQVKATTTNDHQNGPSLPLVAKRWITRAGPKGIRQVRTAASKKSFIWARCLGIVVGDPAGIVARAAHPL